MPNSPQININAYNCLLIDLDNTLYSHSTGALAIMEDRIHLYMIEALDFPEDVVPSLSQSLFQKYGTTLRGLQAEYTVDVDAFLKFVHDAPLEALLSPSPELDQIFKSLPQQKFIFTNAHAAHASRVLNIVGVSHHFTSIIDFYALTPYSKPKPGAFQKALEIVKVDPRKCLMVDDDPKNLDVAQSLGMGTICVGKHRHNGSPHFDTILGLAELIS